MRSWWTKRLGLALGMAGATSLAGARAGAQTAEDKAAAEALFDDGVKLFNAKRFPEACPKLEASQKLDPGIGTLLYIADCYEGLGRIASAWATFRDAAAQAQAAGQGPRERVARARAARLDSRLFKLTLQVAAADTAGLKVRRGEADVRKEVWGSGLPVDPGEYTITASAPGKKAWSTKVKIPEGAGARTIAVPALEDGPAEPLPPPGPRVDVAPPAPPPGAPEPSGLGGQRIAGITVGVVGLAALGAGGIFGGMAAGANSEAKRLCPLPRCFSQNAVDSSQQAGTYANVSTGLFIAGGAAAAAGLVVLLTAPSAKPAAKAWITPVVGGGYAGLQAGRTW